PELRRRQQTPAQVLPALRQAHRRRLARQDARAARELRGPSPHRPVPQNVGGDGGRFLSPDVPRDGPARRRGRRDLERSGGAAPRAHAALGRSGHAEEPTEGGTTQGRGGEEEGRASWGRGERAGGARGRARPPRGGARGGGGGGGGPGPPGAPGGLGGIEGRP